MIHTIRANHPILEQTHRSPIKPIGANNTETEERDREKSERERDKDIVERVGELEQMREKRNKIIFLFLQLCYSAILHVELHCSTIANFFAIVYIYNSLHLAFAIPSANALMVPIGANYAK